MSLSTLKLLSAWNWLQRILGRLAGRGKAVDSPQAIRPTRRKTKRVFFEMP